MATAGERLINIREVTRKQQRQSRKQIRADIVNLKRNIVIEKSENVVPVLSEAEKLKLWRMEKKKKMEEEKLKRKPPFVTYVKVRHTGTSPFVSRLRPALGRLKGSKIEEPIVTEGMKTRSNLIIKQVSENCKKPPEKVRATKQVVNNVPPKIVPNNRVLQLKSAKNEFKVPIEATKLKAPEVERKAMQINQPNKPSTRCLKKAEIKPKPPPVRQIRNKKGPVIENKENEPKIVKSATSSSSSSSVNSQSKYLTRSKKKTESAKLEIVIAEPSNGPSFQRSRLAEETAKLQEFKDKWLVIREDTDLPESIQDEIISVTGHTTLLITSKLEQFKMLIEQCAKDMGNNSNKLTVTPSDLDGFWELVYIEIAQLSNKYINLERLMINNWVQPVINKVKNKPKKTIMKTPMPKKKSKSRFQEFLKKKMENNNSTKGENTDIVQIEGFKQDFNLEGEEEILKLDSFKNCVATPKAIRNVLKARNSRRSSIDIVVSMSAIGKFGTPEKSVD